MRFGAPAGIRKSAGGQAARHGGARDYRGASRGAHPNHLSARLPWFGVLPMHGDRALDDLRSICVEVGGPSWCVRCSTANDHTTLPVVMSTAREGRATTWSRSPGGPPLSSRNPRPTSPLQRERAPRAGPRWPRAGRRAAGCLDALALERAVMIADSFRCPVVTAPAPRHPEWAARLALVSPTIGPQVRVAW